MSKRLWIKTEDGWKKIKTYTYNTIVGHVEYQYRHKGIRKIALATTHIRRKKPIVFSKKKEKYKVERITVGITSIIVWYGFFIAIMTALSTYTNFHSAVLAVLSAIGHFGAFIILPSIVNNIYIMRERLDALDGKE